MDQLMLQIWGGGLSLLNKFFLWRAEHREGEKKRFWLIRAWLVFLFSSPPWIIIYVQKDNWIIVSIAISSIVPKILGLINAVYGINKTPKWLNHVTLPAIVIGIAVSLHILGFMATPTQALELVIVTGFTFGTYLLANQNPAGYIGFMVTHAFSTVLLVHNRNLLLAFCQLVSFGLMCDAYRVQRGKRKATQSVPGDLQ